MRNLNIPPQLFRLLLLAVGIVAFYLTARYLLTPATFGAYGFYRSRALDEISSQEPVFAGLEACEECHAEEVAMVRTSEHKTLSCETCHGVSKAHVENPDIQVGQDFRIPCMRCHEANPSRPGWLKQITTEDHYTGERCTECHLPHQPNEFPEEEEQASADPQSGEEPAL